MKRESINPVLGGYFERIFQMLVGLHPVELFSHVYSSQAEILSAFFEHMGVQSIHSVFVRLLNFSETVFENKKCYDEAVGTRQLVV